MDAEADAPGTSEGACLDDEDLLAAGVDADAEAVKIAVPEDGVLAVDDERRLGDEARAAIAAVEQVDGIGISAITPWEIALLAEKDRLRLAREVGAWIAAALALPGIGLIPIEPAIAIDSVRLPGAFHADPADRFIVATARHCGAPLLTADSAILSYAAGGHVRTIDALC